jgi:hypothetical protein
MCLEKTVSLPQRAGPLPVSHAMIFFAGDFRETDTAVPR